LELLARGKTVYEPPRYMTVNTVRVAVCTHVAQMCRYHEMLTDTPQEAIPLRKPAITRHNESKWGGIQLIDHNPSRCTSPN
jgi:hypothetical protein